MPAQKKTGTKMPEPAVDPKELDDGPKRGERGEYLPARYKTQRGIVREDR